MSRAFAISNLATGRIVLSVASLLLLLLFLPACAVFRSVNKSVSDSTSFKQVESKSNTTLNAEINRDIVFSYADSDKISYRVEIIPEGDIIYSPGAVFKGRAKSLIISGKQASWRAEHFEGAETRELGFDSAGSTTVGSREQIKIREGKLQRESGGGRAIFLGFCLLFVALFWIRMRKVI